MSPHFFVFNNRQTSFCQLNFISQLCTQQTCWQQQAMFSVAFRPILVRASDCWFVADLSPIPVVITFSEMFCENCSEARWSALNWFFKKMESISTQSRRNSILRPFCGKKKTFSRCRLAMCTPFLSRVTQSAWKGGIFLISDSGSLATSVEVPLIRSEIGNLFLLPSRVAN